MNLRKLEMWNFEIFSQVLFAYIARANENNVDTVIQMKGFHLLSNQLYNFPVTPAIMDILFSIVLNRKFSLEAP